MKVRKKFQVRDVRPTTAQWCLSAIAASAYGLPAKRQIQFALGLLCVGQTTEHRRALIKAGSTKKVQENINNYCSDEAPSALLNKPNSFDKFKAIKDKVQGIYDFFKEKWSAIANNHLPQNCMYNLTFTTKSTNLSSFDAANVTTNLSLICKGQSRKTQTKLCPSGLKAFAPGVCYSFKENQSHPPLCPYKNFLPYYKTKVLIKFLKLDDTSIWIHALRNRTTGYGHFEWIERGIYHGQPLITNVDCSNRNIDHDCLIVQNGIFIPVHCDERHSTLCVYSYSSSRYCKNYFQKKACISAHFDFLNGGCFCKEHFAKPHQSRATSCSTLAEPNHSFQTHMILQGFSESQACWFGLEKLQNGSAVWSSTKKLVTYDYWSRSTDCNETNGAITFENDSGWTLLKDKSLNCSICEIKPTPVQSRLILEHDVNRDILELIISNPYTISDIDGTYDLYCFSNSNTDDFMETLPLNKRFLIHNSTLAKLNLLHIRNHPSHYWCKAFQLPSGNVIYSNTIVTYNRTNGYGHEFALVLSIDVTARKNPLLEKLHVQACNFLMEKLNEETVQALRPMTIIELDELQNHMDIIVHLTTKSTEATISNQYKEITQIFDEINSDQNEISIRATLSTEICFADATTTSDNKILEWPDTRIGATAIPVNRLCLDVDNDMLPVTRTCEGDFMYGARWSKVAGDCYENTVYPETTEELFVLLHSNTSSQETVSSLVTITESTINKTVIDVSLTSSIMEKISLSADFVDGKEFFKSISNVMKYNRSILREAQSLLNSTDLILSSLDEFLIRDESDRNITGDNLLSKIINLDADVGVALYKGPINTSDFQYYTFNELPKGTNLKELIKNPDLEAAILFSEGALKEIRCKLVPDFPIKLIVTMFYDDVLFNEREKNKSELQSKSHVISASIPGFSGLLKSPIYMLYKLNGNYSNRKSCSFWEYGWSPLMISTHGKWIFDTVSHNTTNSIEICDFYHLTHFGLLLQVTLVDGWLIHDHCLELLTAIGSALSLLGVIPILITAVVDKTWRSRPGTIILVQFCITITIQTVLLFVTDLVTENGVFCILIGASLHYMVLSEFCWMFAIALLQHRRFVLIMTPPPPNILKRCAIIGWCLPLLPVIVTLAISPSNYGINENKFCYPLDNYFLFGLLIPIIVVFCFNAMVFAKIFFNISRMNSSTIPRNRNFKVEVLLALLLFFILGITWIFGLIGAFGGGIVFIYIFCLTATMRGLVLFLYFILGNKRIRQMWRRRSSYYVNAAVSKFTKSKQMADVSSTCS